MKLKIVVRTHCLVQLRYSSVDATRTAARTAGIHRTAWILFIIDFDVHINKTILHSNDNSLNYFPFCIICAALCMLLNLGKASVPNVVDTGKGRNLFYWNIWIGCGDIFFYFFPLLLLSCICVYWIAKAFCFSAFKLNVEYIIHIKICIRANLIVAAALKLLQKHTSL